jgi:hypothetical protein
MACEVKREVKRGHILNLPAAAVFLRISCLKNQFHLFPIIF